MVSAWLLSHAHANVRTPHTQAFIHTQAYKHASKTNEMDVPRLVFLESTASSFSSEVEESVDDNDEEDDEDFEKDCRFRFFLGGIE